MKAVVTCLIVLLFASLAALRTAGTPHILLREALQFENIGDSGRVPGTLRLIREHLPDAVVTLWPWQLHQERERELFLRAFPGLRIVFGEVDEAGKASTAELASAWKDADILITPARQAKNFTA